MLAHDLSLSNANIICRCYVLTVGHIAVDLLKLVQPVWILQETREDALFPVNVALC